MLKIKDWLVSKNNTAQFKVIDAYSDGGIKTVQRLNDNAIIVRFMPYGIASHDEFSAFYFVGFHDDLIYIDYEFHINSETKKGSCQIDNVIINRDNKVISVSDNVKN